MKETELRYVLALLRVQGIGDIFAKKLIQHCGGAEAVFTADAAILHRIDGIGEIAIQRLKAPAVLEKADAELEYIRKHNIKVLYYQDDDYPERLKHCIDGPVLLFTAGKISFPEQKIISIVGTRQVTPYGTEFCKKLIADLAPLNPVIVSGFAYGVDIVAHQAAMEHQLQTIGVLAHGLNQTYPPAHRKYCPKMEENGGFVTEFWSSSNPDKENFVKRNRIVAGMSEATIVIESAGKGGSLITAGMANDYNRDVFAVPGRVTDKYSQGCNNLIKTQKANVLTDAADLVYMLNWDLAAEKCKPVQKQLFVALEEEEEKVYQYLNSKGKEVIDRIALECNLPIYKVASLLLKMELKGVIRPLPGKLFEAV
ncbi:DNA-processing protein DprA [Flavobacterium kingsejongi]|uniref:DNA protecting protein DprA n=1 Tax=Flavobacterium kingsejongi TaxID=1678728 RepID=A0A2S1LLZ9_9FLAO|nr:DNA-processing protein DprA [Flavobacterium kingsejongi]AWG24606.1 DNA protecting protein DprA [Flavobacterium kingsejongi]